MKKFSVLILLSTVSLSVLSQNLPNADFKRWQFGFNVGINAFDFGIENSMLVQGGKIYQAEVSTIMPGLAIGLMGGVRLNDYFNLRLVPTLYLGERTLSYMNDVDDEIFKASIRSTTLSVPLHVKFSSVRVGNVKPYLLAGGGVMFDFTHDKTKPVLLNYTDFFVEFGAGCTFYFEYFRFSPEIRFAIGLTNVKTSWEERIANPGEYLDPEFQPYNDGLSKLTNRVLTVVFNFE